MELWVKQVRDEREAAVADAAGVTLDLEEVVELNGR
jgi:hypothetical protein